jgi:hypothetical protein
MLPLNGTKTHPLSAVAKAAIESLRTGPRPAQEFNPGIVDRLLREGCVEIIELPSPYKTRKGNVAHLRLVVTAKGPQ